MAPTYDEENLMTEKVKKSTAPKKPRVTASKETAPKESAPNNKRATKGNVTQMVSPDEIARLAHQYWAERGHQDGHHEEDWYRAEQELRGKAS